MKLPRRSWLRINPASLTLAVLLLVVLLFLSGAPILDLIELKAYDLRFLSRGPRPPSPVVVMAAIDEKSRDLGPGPGPPLFRIEALLGDRREEPRCGRAVALAPVQDRGPRRHALAT